METSGIVAEFDVADHVIAGVFTSGVLGAVNPLILQGSEE
jgi:hypothetical protein